MKLKMAAPEGTFTLVEHTLIRNENVQRRIRGNWELPVAERYWESPKCRVEQGDVVIDVGADIGIFAIHAGNSGASRYYGFEPNEPNRVCLLHNVKLGRNGSVPVSQVYGYAVSDKIGKAVFWEGNGITAHGLIDRHLDEPSRPVETVTLDWLFAKEPLNAVGLLRVDCNGSEAAVFDGLSPANLAKVRKVVVQYHHVLDQLRPDWYGQFLKRLRGAKFSVGLKPFNEYGDNVILAWR